MIRRRAAGLALGMALACCSPQWAAAQSSTNYKLPVSLMNAGVGDVASPSYKLSSSLGDGYFTGPGTSTNYRMAHGLWISGVVSAPAPVLASAASRKVHGSAGTFDLLLSAVTTNPTTEPRQGPTATVVLTFDKAVTGATAAITEGTATAAAPTFSGNDVVVNLTGVSNQQYVTIGLSNVTSADGGIGGTGSVRLGFLAGDVNQTRVVSIADLGLVNAQLSQLVTVANYLKDVNASGTLTLADKGITNANLTKALPPP